MLIAVPLLIFWMLTFCWQQGLFGSELSDVNAAWLVIVSFGFFIGLLFCFAAYAWEMRRINKAVKEIDEFTEKA